MAEVLHQKPEIQSSIMPIAFVLAVIVHVFLFYVAMPESQRVAKELAQEKKFPKITKVITLKQEEQQQTQTRRLTIKPVPDPTPQEPEPIPQRDDLLQENLIVNEPTWVVEIEEPEVPEPEGPQRLSATMKAPSIIKRVEPEYPILARNAKIQGVVILEAVINKDGTVGEVKVIRGLGKSGCDEAAIDAVKQWVFSPAEQNGRPISVYFTLTVNFQLK